jgi:hypothetical protein
MTEGQLSYRIVSYRIVSYRIVSYRIVPSIVSPHPDFRRSPQLKVQTAHQPAGSAPATATREACSRSVRGKALPHHPLIVLVLLCVFLFFIVLCSVCMARTVCEYVCHSSRTI